MLNFTASASNGVPSWKVTPSRSCRVIDLPSSDRFQDVARPGTVRPLSSSFVSVSTL